jgi:hypothetical protein
LTPHHARGRGHRHCTSRRAEGGEGGEAAGRRVRRGGQPFVPAAAGAPMVGGSKEPASRPCQCGQRRTRASPRAMPLRPCSLRPLLSVDDAGAARRVRGAAEAAVLAVSVPIGGYSAARRSSFSAGRVAMTDRKIRPLPRSSIEAAALEQVRSVRMPVEFLSSFHPRHLVFCPFGWLFFSNKKNRSCFSCEIQSPSCRYYNNFGAQNFANLIIPFGFFVLMKFRPAHVVSCITTCHRLHIVLIMNEHMKASSLKCFPSKILFVYYYHIFDLFIRMFEPVELFASKIGCEE